MYKVRSIALPICDNRSDWRPTSSQWTMSQSCSNFMDATNMTRLAVHNHHILIDKNVYISWPNHMFCFLIVSHAWCSMNASKFLFYKFLAITKQVHQVSSNFTSHCLIIIILPIKDYRFGLWLARQWFYMKKRIINTKHAIWNELQ